MRDFTEEKQLILDLDAAFEKYCTNHNCKTCPLNGLNNVLKKDYCFELKYPVWDLFDEIK